VLASRFSDKRRGAQRPPYDVLSNPPYIVTDEQPGLDADQLKKTGCAYHALRHADGRDWRLKKIILAWCRQAFDAGMRHIEGQRFMVEALNHKGLRERVPATGRLSRMHDGGIPAKKGGEKGAWLDINCASDFSFRKQGPSRHAWFHIWAGNEARLHFKRSPLLRGSRAAFGSTLPNSLPCGVRRSGLMFFRWRPNMPGFNFASAVGKSAHSAEP